MGKSTQETIRKLSKAIDQWPCGMIMTDAGGTVEYVNERFLEMTGYHARDVLGKSLGMFHDHDTKEGAYRQIWETVTGGGLWKEYMNRDKESSRWEEITYTPFRDETGRFAGVLGTIEDISERKKEEEDMKAARQKAEESDHLKSAFLANMSHEIRTPMNGIIGFANLLKAQDLPRVKINKYIDIIASNGVALLNLIEDIIDVAKIEAGQVKINKSSVNLQKLLSELCDVFREEVRKKRKPGLKVRVRLPDPPLSRNIWMDEFRVRQVLNNLIGNAVKFTEKGHVDFGYECRGKKIEFFVEDTGIGIEKHRLDQVFNRFWQVESGNAGKFGGTGLGLTISKSLVELMQGEIRVESEVNAGTTFRFAIPLELREPGSNDDLRTEKKLYRWPEKIILVVEDEDYNYVFIREMLHASGAKLLWAKNGVEALDIIENHPDIDLVLMDIKMPFMDGLEATRKIRETKPGIPVIVQTAYAMEEEREKIIDSGCDAYIAKPIARDELYLKCNHYLRRK